MALEVFISHSHRDRKTAEALVHFLVVGVGLDTREIRCTSHPPTGLVAGSRIESELRRDLKRCAYFVPLITPNSGGSEYVAFEIGGAWVLEKTVLPVVYAKGEAPRIPAVLSGLLTTDLTDLDSLVKLAGELATAIYVAKDRPSAPQMLAAARAFLAHADA